MRRAARLAIAMAMVAGCLASSVLPALAHAHLVTSTPAVGASVIAPAELRLTFSEGVELAFSSVELIGPNGPMSGALELAGGDKTGLVLHLKPPLAPGDYKVHWHVVSVDTHRTEGTFGFTVK